MASEQTKIPERTEKKTVQFTLARTVAKLGTSNQKYENFQKNKSFIFIFLYFLDFINGLNCFMFVIWYWSAYERIELLLNSCTLDRAFFTEISFVLDCCSRLVFSQVIFLVIYPSFFPSVFTRQCFLPRSFWSNSF